MKHKNALCLAMVCLSAGLCFGQFNPWVPTDNVMPNNGCDNDPQTYPRWFYPDDVITLQYCNRFLGNDNQWHPMPYTPYFLSSYTTRTSGYHTHETFTNHRNGPVFLGNGYGPGVQSFSPTHGIVGDNGCVLQKVQFDGIAGWNTFTGSTPTVGGQISHCVNNFLRYYPVISGLQRDLQSYPTNTLYNQPESFHIDDRHFSGGFSRYLNSDVIPRVVQASQVYRDGSSAYGVVDRLDITRCSLPYGGIADNDWTNLAPASPPNLDFDARPFEQHDKGSQCDIGNPAFGLPGSNLGIIALQSLSQNQCVVPKFTPSGIDISVDPIGWWLLVDKFHISCKPLQGTIQRPRPR